MAQKLYSHPPPSIPSLPSPYFNSQRISPKLRNAQIGNPNSSPSSSRLHAVAAVPARRSALASHRRCCLFGGIAAAARGGGCRSQSTTVESPKPNSSAESGTSLSLLYGLISPSPLLPFSHSRCPVRGVVHRSSNFSVNGCLEAPIQPLGLPD